MHKLQCGFRKGLNAQNCLIVMIEMWKRMLGKGGTCGALLTDLTNESTLKIEQCQKNSSKKEKLLGITIDNKLFFDADVNNMCNKISQNLNALTRIANYINPDQRRVVVKALTYSRRINSCINRLHERVLRLWSFGRAVRHRSCEQIVPSSIPRLGISVEVTS